MQDFSFPQAPSSIEIIFSFYNVPIHLGNRHEYMTLQSINNISISFFFDQASVSFLLSTPSNSHLILFSKHHGHALEFLLSAIRQQDLGVIPEKLSVCYFPNIFFIFPSTFPTSFVHRAVLARNWCRLNVAEIINKTTPTLMAHKDAL